MFSVDSFPFASVFCHFICNCRVFILVQEKKENFKKVYMAAVKLFKLNISSAGIFFV